MQKVRPGPRFGLPGGQRLDPSLFAAVGSYLVLRVTEADARTLARVTGSTLEERRTADRLKALERYTALFFARGASPTYQRSSGDLGSRAIFADLKTQVLRERKQSPAPACVLSVTGTCLDIGNATHSALHKLLRQAGRSAPKTGARPAMGNGGILRLEPVVLAAKGDRLANETLGRPITAGRLRTTSVPRGWSATRRRPRVRQRAIRLR